MKKREKAMYVSPSAAVIGVDLEEIILNPSFGPQTDRLIMMDSWTGAGDDGGNYGQGTDDFFE